MATGSSLITALIYTRVSSDEQAREGVSLDAQLAACREYSARQGWMIGREYTDVMTGKRDDRPEYQDSACTVEAKRPGASRVRAAARASSMFATFAQAIKSTIPARTSSTYSGPWNESTCS